MIPGHSIAMDVSKQHLRGAHGQKVDLGLLHKATICLQLREHTVSIEYGKAFLRADPCLSQGLATYLHSPMELTRSIERWHTRNGSNWSTISSRMNPETRKRGTVNGTSKIEVPPPKHPVQNMPDYLYRLYRLSVSSEHMFFPPEGPDTVRFPFDSTHLKLPTLPQPEPGNTRHQRPDLSDVGAKKHWGHWDVERKQKFLQLF